MSKLTRKAPGKMARRKQRRKTEQEKKKRKKKTKKTFDQKHPQQEGRDAGGQPPRVHRAHQDALSNTPVLWAPQLPHSDAHILKRSRDTVFL